MRTRIAKGEYGEVENALEFVKRINVEALQLSSRNDLCRRNAVIA